MKTIATATETVATPTNSATSAATPKQWDAFPEPKGWSMRWDNSGLVPPQSLRPDKP